MRYLTGSLALVLGIGLVQAAAAGTVLVLNNAGSPPLANAKGNGLVERVVGEAFRRCGVELKVVYLPAERGLRNANAGIEDGEIGRAAGIEQRYPNLLRVPEKIADLELVAFSANPSVSIHGGWSALRSYRVGIIKGWKIYEDGLRGILTPVSVDNADQLFNLIERDRVDVVLYERWMGLAQIRARGLRGVKMLTPPLATMAIYTYLNRRHAALVPKLAAALRALKADGTYQRAFNEAIGSLARP